MSVRIGYWADVQRKDHSPRGLNAEDIVYTALSKLATNMNYRDT